MFTKEQYLVEPYRMRRMRTKNRFDSIRSNGYLPDCIVTCTTTTTTINCLCTRTHTYMCVCVKLSDMSATCQILRFSLEGKLLPAHIEKYCELRVVRVADGGEGEGV